MRTLILHRTRYFPEFEGLVIDMEYHEGDSLGMMVDRMYEKYKLYKKIGVKYFLIQFGWGLGELDSPPNYIYKYVFEKFSGCDGVVFYIGEWYEDIVEAGRFTWEQIRPLVRERFVITHGNLVLDATARNKDKVGATALSSFFHQTKFWRTTDKCAWIYGQFAWHSLIPFIGSHNYRGLSKKAKELGIEMAGLYQGDPDTWSWKLPYTWGNWLLSKLGVREWYEERQRERFIHYFGS